MDISHLGELEIIEYMKSKFGSEIYIPLRDNGIDFIAVNNNKFFQIQVKTSKFQKKSYFWFDLYKNKLICNENTFYIFVCKSLDRRRFMGRKINFLAIPSTDIKKWIDEDKMKLKQNSETIFNLFVYPNMEEATWRYRNKGGEIDLTKYWNNLDFLN